jgi:hypothetical protein
MPPPYCWADLYSVAFTELVNAYIIETGQAQAFESVANSEATQQAILDYSSQNNLTSSAKSGNPKYILLLLNALSKNILAIATLHHSLCEIVEITKTNPQSRLFFEAIKIDKTIINNPVYADQIALAAYRQDDDFFIQLSNALKSTGINKREEEYDNLRFALYLLEVEENVLSKLSQEQAYQLFCVDLDLYPDTGDIDPIGKFIRRWRRSRRT